MARGSFARRCACFATLTRRGGVVQSATGSVCRWKYLGAICDHLCTVLVYALHAGNAACAAYADCLQRLLQFNPGENLDRG